MAHRKKPRPARAARPAPNPSSRKADGPQPSMPFWQRYPRQRRILRNGVVFLVAEALLVGAGIAVANSFSGHGGTALSGAEISQSPTTAATTASPEPTTKPTPKAKPTSSAAPRASHRRHYAEPVVSPTRAPSASPKASPACPSPSTRLAQARASLRHPDALPKASVQTEGPQAGTLGTADLAARTVTLYLRSCAEEPTAMLAVVWMYEAGQFVDVDSWDAATRVRWRGLRGATITSTKSFRQDAASVFAYWQTGSTLSWQSPVAPPSPSQLAQLSTFLTTA